MSAAATGTAATSTAARSALAESSGRGGEPRRTRAGPLSLPTLDLYTARLFLVAYVISTVSFLGLFVLIEAFFKLDRFLRQDTSLIYSLVQYHLAMVPTVYVNLMGPLLTLAAAMFTLTTLTRQNELAPLKAAGISIYRILLPIFVLAALLAAFGFFLQERVIPRFKDPIRSALALARARPLNPAPYKDTEHGYLIRVAEYSTTRKIAHDVEIFETYENVVSKRLICANQMEWIAAGSDSDDERGRWVLHDGSIQEWDSSGDLKINPSGSKAQRLITSFKRMELESSMRPIDLETGDMENSEISYLSSHELRAQYQRNPENHLLAVRLHHHFAFPFAHLILLLLGIPFVLHVRNRSTFISMASCFLIAALYFLVDSLSMHIANSQLFSPILAAWLPVMLFGSLGITLFDNLPS